MIVSQVRIDEVALQAYVFSGKWQAAWCPGASSTSGGSVVRQISCAFQHRVWKRHAGGGLTGLGTSPVNRIRFPRPRAPGAGEGPAAITAAGAGCPGLLYRPG